MKRIAYLFGLVAVAAGLTGCQTTRSAPSAPVPQVALATSQYRDVFNLNRPVVTEFAASDEIAISIYVPRGGGFGVRDGTMIVRNAASGQIIRRETQSFKEDDYVAFKQPNPGPGKYNVEFLADNGVQATTWFEVR